MVTVLLTTTPNPRKADWTLEVLKSIDNTWLTDVKKVISIDGPGALDNRILDYCDSFSWEQVFVRLSSRPKTLLLELPRIKTEWTFYAEDDIRIDRLLSKANTERILEQPHKGRQCAILTPSLGGSTFNTSQGDKGDFGYIGPNTIFEHDGSLVFVRREANTVENFFELGSLFVRTEVFRRCLIHASEKHRNRAIEKGLSLAYTELGYPEFYFKATFCSSNIKTLYKTNPVEADGQSRFITYLDPNQGSGLYSGGHTL